MRRLRRGSREAEVDPFYDMLFNLLIGFVFCFIVALLAMNPRAPPRPATCRLRPST
jgi:hypothetical protein